MTSMVLAQPFLLGDRNIKSGHDGENWAFMSILKSQSGYSPVSIWVPPICCVSVYDDVWHLWLWTAKQQQIGPL